MQRTNSSQKQRKASAQAKRDPWDEELADEEPGSSWSKSYVGGVKHRSYTER